MIRVETPEDPRAEPFLAVRERDLVGRQGRFIAEGEVVLRRLLEAPDFRLERALLAENRVARLAPAIAARSPQTEILVAAQPVLDRIAGFHLHRGILGLGARRRPASAADLLATLAPDARILALFGVANPDNVGSIFRNAAAFGIAAVLLDEACCDPLYRKALRVAVGSSLIVPFARVPAGPAGLALVEAAGFEVLALSPRGETTLAALEPPARFALAFGAEGPGLPEAILARCRTVRIEMEGAIDSLNVSAAAAVALHALYVKRAG